MKIPELTERINKINALLDDPHPGLGTWCAFLGQRMGELIAAWQGEPAPVEQEADGELLKNAYDVWCAANGGQKGLEAALAIARAHSAHPPEGWYSTEQVKTATEQAARVCHHLGLGFGEMWDQIRARLTPPQKPVERVATRFLGDRWEITLDGGWWASVNAEEKALVVAAGLRASLDAGKEIRGE
jgi:hypothetical protein